MISRTFLPFALKYSAIDVALSAPLILSKGDLSAGTAIIVVLFFVSSLRISETKLPSSLPLSPINATITMSAFVNFVIIPKSIDLPTPEPAIIPNL